jgi:hypothetical protein
VCSRLCSNSYAESKVDMMQRKAARTAAGVSC